MSITTARILHIREISRTARAAEVKAVCITTIAVILIVPTIRS